MIEDGKAPTEYHQLQQRLRTERALLQTLIDNLPDFIFQKDRESRFVVANRALAKAAGLDDPAEMIGKTDRDFFPPQIAENFVAEDHVVFETARQKQNIEEPVISASGSLTWVLTTKVPLFDANGRVSGLLGIGRDITARKELEKKNQLLATLVEYADDAIVGFDFERNVTSWNQGAEHLYGYTEEEVIGTPTSRYIPPELEDQARQVRERVLRDGRVTHYKTMRLRKDGTRITVSITLSAIRDPSGRITGMASVARDVTERERAEQALAQKAALLAQAEAVSHMGSWRMDLATGTVIWSDEMYKIFGIDRATFGHDVNEAVSRAVHPDDRTKLDEINRAVLADGRPRPSEYRILHPDGTIHWVLGQGEQERDTTGNVVALAGFVQDITERKGAEEQLLLLKHTIDASPDPAYWFKRNGRFIYVNDAGCRALGYSHDEILRMSLGDVNPAATTEVLGEIWKEVTERGTIKGESVHRRKDGSEFPVEITSTYFRLGENEYCNGYAIDITERRRVDQENKRLQAQLQQSQKMETVGRLAGGVAHDFNNMLGVILGHAQIALEELDPAQPLHASLTEIRKAAERSTDLTRQLLSFARKQAVAPKVLDLNETIAGMLKMLQRLIGEDITLEWRPKEGLWPVRVDPSQVDQLLANLCVNARDAIAGVGRIAIETGNRVFDEEYCASRPHIAPGEYVQLAVSDNGAGMDEETLAHVFEPFFTTKAVGKGTGLGLATVYGIVKQNNGFIDVHSVPGKGAVFSLLIPRDMGRSAKVQRDSDTEPGLRGQETILVVEDEPANLKLILMMLGRQGYNLLAAGTPGEAIRLAREHPGDIHLLMTDVVMPEMNGRELARNLLPLYPYIRSLFMSGYTADIIAHHGVLDEGVSFIQKPFSAASLAEKIRETLQK